MLILGLLVQLDSMCDALTEKNALENIEKLDGPLIRTSHMASR